MQRRQFLKAMTVCGLAACGRADEPARRPRVVVARLRDAAGRDDPARLRDLLVAGLEALFEDPWAALSQLFGDTGLIGLKVNCVSRHLSTRPALCQAVVRVLARAQIGPERVLVFDRSNQELDRNGRYELNRSEGGPLCYGCRQTPYEGGSYRPYVCEGAEFSISSLVTGCRALISMPVLKHHAMTGVTLSLKNYYGVLERPTLWHGPLLNCSPYLAQLMTTEVLASRQKLVICDALVGMCDGGPYGPGRQWPFGGLILSANAPAADIVGWQIINAERGRRGLAQLALPQHLEDAGERGLGPAGLADIDRVTVAV
ncbi:MAG: DUF362 domain-containing protein [Armatimonadota bacterium]